MNPLNVVGPKRLEIVGAEALVEFDVCATRFCVVAAGAVLADALGCIVDS